MELLLYRMGKLEKDVEKLLHAVENFPEKFTVIIGVATAPLSDRITANTQRIDKLSERLDEEVGALKVWQATVRGGIGAGRVIAGVVAGVVITVIGAIVSKLLT